MTATQTKPRRRRLKNGVKWPSWLRDPRMLKWAFFVGLNIWRYWRLLKGLTDMFDG